MGTSFDNCQVRANSVEDVTRVLESLGITAFLSGIANGWISVYPHESFGAGETAQALSEHLQTTAIYLWQFDSDIDGYSLFHNGNVIDEFISYLEYGLDPEDVEATITPEIRSRYTGNPQAVLPFCLPDATETSVRDSLSDLYYPDKLCHALGLTYEHCVQAFRFIERGEATFPCVKVNPPVE